MAKINITYGTGGKNQQKKNAKSKQIKSGPIKTVWWNQLHCFERIVPGPDWTPNLSSVYSSTRAGKKRKAEFNMFILSMIPMDVHPALKNLATWAWSSTATYMVPLLVHHWRKTGLCKTLQVLGPLWLSVKRDGISK